MSRLLLLGAGGSSWVEVFTANRTTEGNSLGYNGYTIVQTVPLASFSRTGGSQIRLTFGGPTSSEDMEFAACWVGNGGGGDEYDFTGDQVQLKSGGSNTITVPKNGTLTTDAATFTKDGTNSLVVAVELTNSAADDIRWLTANTFGKFFYRGGGYAEAAVQNKASAQYGAGLTTSSLCIAKIELLI